MLAFGAAAVVAVFFGGAAREGSRGRAHFALEGAAVEATPLAAGAGPTPPVHGVEPPGALDVRPSGAPPSDAALRILGPAAELERPRDPRLASLRRPVETSRASGHGRHEREVPHLIMLAGRVVDPEGRPLPRVGIQANGNRPVRSADDGTFRLGAFAPGPVTLDASLAGFRRVTLALGTCEEPVDGLEIVLGAGLEIAGRVTWPDGTPAEARVSATLVRASVASDPAAEPLDAWSCDTAPDGSFRFRGLAAGVDAVYDVRARAPWSERVQRQSTLEGERLRDPPPAKAWDQRVPAGATGLQLVLGPGLAVEVRASDDEGAPIRTVEISARSLELEASFKRKVYDDDGIFLLEGLEPGAWSLGASSLRYGDAEATVVTLPGSERITLVLPRTGEIRGRVLLPDGTPARHPIVAIGSKTRLAHKDGSFAFRVPPGPVRLHARMQGYAPSDEVELVLEPRQELTDVELRLAPRTLPPRRAR